MKQFFSDICNLLIGGLTVVLSLIIGFIYWVFDADYLIPLWSIVILSLAFYIISLVLYSVFKRPKEEIFRLPVVKKIVERNNDVTLILEKNELYSINSVVSIYYEDEIQNLIGLGFVETINDKGYMQIKVLKKLDENDLKGKLNDSSKNRNALKIKPTISIDMWNGGTLNEANN